MEYIIRIIAIINSPRRESTHSPGHACGGNPRTTVPPRQNITKPSVNQMHSPQHHAQLSYSLRDAMNIFSAAGYLLSYQISNCAVHNCHGATEISIQNLSISISAYLSHEYICLETVGTPVRGNPINGCVLVKQSSNRIATAISRLGFCRGSQCHKSK